MSPALECGREARGETKEMSRACILRKGGTVRGKAVKGARATSWWPVGEEKGEGPSWGRRVEEGKGGPGTTCLRARGVSGGRQGARSTEAGDVG
jgi:hypothetical protein